MLSHALIILQRCALRHWRSDWRQQVLLLLILSLGTAVFVAIRLANGAALSGFERFADGVTRLDGAKRRWTAFD
jgi:putative ABC transport system permease protein